MKVDDAWGAIGWARRISSMAVFGLPAAKVSWPRRRRASGSSGLISEHLLVKLVGFDHPPGLVMFDCEFESLIDVQ